ncbi:toxin-antitoxin system [Nocardia vinacea]|uniref:toxin-antitoxin system n=1 Tax=Nocardia vinacea TaxID=96468 RepID=UPI00344838B9
MTVTRLPKPVRDEVEALAAARGTHMSQVVADLVAKALGRDDLVLELTQEALPMTAA